MLKPDIGRKLRFLAQLGCPCRNITITFGTEKLQSYGYPMVKKIWRDVYLFQQNTRTYRTDRRTPHDGIASRGKNTAGGAMLLISALIYGRRPPSQRIVMSIGLPHPAAYIHVVHVWRLCEYNTHRLSNLIEHASNRHGNQLDLSLRNTGVLQFRRQRNFISTRRRHRVNLVSTNRWQWAYDMCFLWSMQSATVMQIFEGRTQKKIDKTRP